MSAPVLQSTPGAQSTGWIFSALSNTQTICIFSPLLFTEFVPRQCVHVFVYVGFKYNKKNMCLKIEPLHKYKTADLLWAAEIRYYGSLLRLK